MNRVPHCAECEYMKKYDYGKKIYYCDHTDRIDDMPFTHFYEKLIPL